jgi:CSLREA domain-containing protein
MIVIKTRRVTEHRALVPGFLLLASTVACLLLIAGPAWAAAFAVNSTADRGDQAPGDGACFTGEVLIIGDECTLRAAIEEANANDNGPTVDRITFDVPTTGVATITPATELPTITEPTIINGYSQQGASVNTATTGTNAVLKIVLDGSDAGSTPTQPVDGLTVTARNSTIRGLVINNGFRAGVVFDEETPSDAGRTLEGCFIGTDVSGTQDLGHGGGVIIDDGAGNVIGGTDLAARNLISGNDTGVFISQPANGNRIQGNLIGTNKDGTSTPNDLGNRTGIHIVGGSDNTIGGNNAASNTIAFNNFHGIQVQAVSDPGSGTGNSILANSIFSNAALGIQLGAESVAGGVTPNDPGDGDTGANNLQNFPQITSAVTFGGATTIGGRLNSTPNRTYTIRYFSNPGAEADSSGFGEGKTFLGQKTVETNRNGNASVNFAPDRTVPIGYRVTATATNGGGNTSEFSNARIVERPVIGP